MKVFLLAKTIMDKNILQEYLYDIKANKYYIQGNWPEELVSVAGKICYRSFQEGMNDNVKSVRHGHEHIQNMIRQGHGNVLEHMNATFILSGVSRVLTHELVRHRAGMAYSQESLRFVRLSEEMEVPIPECIRENVNAVILWNSMVIRLKQVQEELNKIFNLDSMSMADKKMFTSAFRRLAPIGMLTTIMFTANLRALRHIIVTRTNKAAEAEIRNVFKKVGEICKNEWPDCFFDFECNEDGEWISEYGKV